jgi:pyruvate formate lyase activating enzyme
MSPEPRTPLILEIKGNSLDDGPGIRSVVFFKGCPLSCVWCHNPESKKTGPEISFDPKTCVDCGTCRKVCPEKALSTDNPGYINRQRCTLCFLCVDACPSGALSRVGQALTVAQVLEKILPDKPFFDASRGGVTLSGGEPTLFAEYAGDLLAALKKENIHTLLETCGLFDFDRFMHLLYPSLDAVYFDIKIHDDSTHRKYCGVSNKKILENFEKLLPIAETDGKVLLPRTPLIPGITDGEENLKAIAAYLSRLGVKEAALLAYNPLWHEKTDKIGCDNSCRNDTAMTRFMPGEAVARCREIFNGYGIKG